MKTKIRTLIATCILGTIGLININAIADNKKAVNAQVVAEKIEMVTTESLMTDVAFYKSAEAITAREAEAKIVEFATKQIVLHKNKIANSNIQTSAESLTSSESDKEIEKYARKLVSMQMTRIRK